MLKEGDVYYFTKDVNSKKGVWVKIKEKDGDFYAIDMNPKKPYGITRAFPIRECICYMNEAKDASFLN